MKITVIGNTKQTKIGLERLVKEGYDVTYVFGLPETKASNKVSFVPLDDFCLDHNIVLDTSDNWDNLLDIDSDLVICLGDSRIVPERVLEKHKVIGNHGAVLPYVQGGASYVWGRMLNTGTWGISIMELDKVVDAGKILVTKEFQYHPECSMEEFCDNADRLTIDALFEYLSGDHEPRENSKWNVKISRHTDSKFVVDILRETLENGKNIYLPPRRPIDSEINHEWGEEFVDAFKKANNSPYPRWTE